MAGFFGEALSVAPIARRLAPFGLNLVGVARVADYDAGVAPERRLSARAPGSRSAVVVGSGGAAFWHAYRRFCAAHPRHETRADPLDDYTRHAVRTACAPFLERGPVHVVHPFGFAADGVSFPRLAELAGLGRRSLVGVLVHPVFGPWIALRAALLVPVELDAPRPAEGFDPCPACVERPCIATCPGGAVGAAGWDVPRCAAARSAEVDPCAGACHARVTCVLGRAHRYPSDALAYHQGRAREPLVRFSGR
jgi:hypothetical protein